MQSRRYSLMGSRQNPESLDCLRLNYTFHQKVHKVPNVKNNRFIHILLGQKINRPIARPEGTSFF